jgi:hypothetical protein
LLVQNPLTHPEPEKEENIPLSNDDINLQTFIFVCFYILKKLFFYIKLFFLFLNHFNIKNNFLKILIRCIFELKITIFTFSFTHPLWRWHSTLPFAA